MLYMPQDMRKEGDLGKVHITGDYEDKIFKKGRLVQTVAGHNIIVDSFLILTMMLMKNAGGYSGVQYWAVGSGAISWDSDMPDPSRSETVLVNEIGRVAIDPADIKFLNADYEETNVPTNILKITAHFGENDANGQWREFGLFGGDSTTVVDSGIMLDKRNHSLITKTREMTIDRTLRLSIQFA